jgi:hypothetical protein
MLRGGLACVMAIKAQSASVQSLKKRGSAAEDSKPVRLEIYGGKPGAAPFLIKEAFTKAFAELFQRGGGTLIVPPGVYDFGDYTTGTNVLQAEELTNVTISGYGATFRMHTRANVMPCLFYFTNPNNVNIAGASFEDPGYSPLVNWRGMYCVGAEATRECSGFRMIDCSVNGAVGLFQSQSEGANRYLMKNISLKATVKNAYYGAALAYAGDNAALDLICENVRRGCIAYALRNASIRIKMTHKAGAAGSNGFISLVCEGATRGDVENVRINLEASGVQAHNALVHFYHEENQAQGYMRNIDASVILNNLQPGSVTTSMFLFDHELHSTAIAPTTQRGWDQIFLHGSIIGPFSGRVVSNPSISTSPCEIFIDADLAALIDLAQLPDYFQAAQS